MKILIAKIVVIVCLYLIIFVYFNNLNFELAKDELHFWPTTLEFSKSYIPSLETLRNYNELNSPLPFYLFGIIEKTTNAGPQGGRLLNFIASFTMAILIAVNKGLKPLISCFVLLLFPYFLGTSTYLYTDIICAFFVMTGYLAYKQNRPMISTALFICAIASRQYAVAFPVGILAYTVIARGKNIPMIIAMIVAAISILPWMLLWGGFSPPVATAAQNLATSSLLRIFPDHSLYFMSCVGLYFVLPEYLINHRFQLPRIMNKKMILAVVIITGALFSIFPPLRNVNYDIPTMGYLDKISRIFLPDFFRMIAFFILAVFAALRFANHSPEAWLFWANTAIMLKAHIGWDKYILPLLVCLCLSQALGAASLAARSLQTMEEPGRQDDFSKPGQTLFSRPLV